MKLLLDTPVVLWVLAEPAKLAARTRTRVADPANTVAVSAASAWHICLQVAAGTLEFDGDLREALADADLLPLPITVDDAVAAAGLPPHHRDPFGRMLVAQALAGGWTLVTRSSRLAEYGVAVLAA